MDEGDMEAVDYTDLADALYNADFEVQLACYSQNHFVSL